MYNEFTKTIQKHSAIVSWGGLATWFITTVIGIEFHSCLQKFEGNSIWTRKNLAMHFLLMDIIFELIQITIEPIS